MGKVVGLWMVALLALPACGNDGGGKLPPFDKSDTFAPGEDGWTEDSSSLPDEGGPGQDIPTPPAGDSRTTPEEDTRSTPDEDAVSPPPPAGPCSALQSAESLADLESAYSAANWKQTLVDVLDRRYDPGHYILTHAKDQSQLQNFVKTGSFQELVMSASVAVHEMNHLYGWELSGWSDYGYFLCAEQILKVAAADTPPRNVVATLLDESVGNLVATYADIYLTGVMGGQGFWTLVDELNAYTHSIFVDYQLLDRLPTGLSISSLDGLTTFMLFTELYLKWVRTNQPASYDAIVNAPGVKAMLLAVWDRAEWIIVQTEPVSYRLSLDADGIKDRVYDTDQYTEIELLRD